MCSCMYIRGVLLNLLIALSMLCFQEFAMLKCLHLVALMVSVCNISNIVFPIMSVPLRGVTWQIAFY